MRLHGERPGRGSIARSIPRTAETYLFSECFLYEAQRIFACFDQPDLKAPLTLRVRAPVEWTVLSTSAGALADDGRTWEFPATPPLATYLMVVVAGPYHERPPDARRHRTGPPRASIAGRAISTPTSCSRSPASRSTSITGSSRCRIRSGSTTRCSPEYEVGAMENSGVREVRDDSLLRSRVTDARARPRPRDRPRDGAQVVRRPRHHALVGRPVAERVVRRVHGDARHRRGHSLQCTVGLVLRIHQGVGLPPGRAPDHPPDRRRRPDTEAALLNLDGISYAKGAGVLKQRSRGSASMPS